jgi:hypothetical protein
VRRKFVEAVEGVLRRFNQLLCIREWDWSLESDAQREDWFAHLGYVSSIQVQGKQYAPCPQPIPSSLAAAAPPCRWPSSSAISAVLGRQLRPKRRERRTGAAIRFPRIPEAATLVFEPHREAKGKMARRLCPLKPWGRCLVKPSCSSLGRAVTFGGVALVIRHMGPCAFTLIVEQHTGLSSLISR